MESRNTRRADRLGILFVFVAACLYSIGGLCMKFIPWSGLSINSARTMVSTLVIGAYLLATRHRLRCNRSIFIGALCACGTNVLFSMANKLTTAGNAIVLQFTAPVFVMVLSFLLWHKRPKGRDILTCFLVLGGVICFFLDNLDAGRTLGNFLAIAAGVAYAGVFMLNEMPDSDPISSIFLGGLISVAVGLPSLVQETDFSLIPMISVIILGAFQVGVAYILMCIGLKTTPAVTACLISGIEPVLSPILVAIFCHEALGPLALVGAAIVIVSILAYNILNARQDACPAA